jgi:hypothetical protein
VVGAVVEVVRERQLVNVTQTLESGLLDYLQFGLAINCDQSMNRVTKVFGPHHRTIVLEVKEVCITHRGHLTAEAATGSSDWLSDGPPSWEPMPTR